MLPEGERQAGLASLERFLRSGGQMPAPANLNADQFGGVSNTCSQAGEFAAQLRKARAGARN